VHHLTRIPEAQIGIEGLEQGSPPGIAGLTIQTLLRDRLKRVGSLQERFRLSHG
jgi:hypothetical protein